jgi:hypothetical protein
MKYQPKSIIGAILAGLYLLFVALLLLVMGYWVIVNNWNVGGHGDPGVLIIALLLIVTLPLSFPLIEGLNWIVDVLKLEPTKETVGFIQMFIIPAVSALINAVIIYYIVVFLSQILRKLFKHSGGNDKTE